MFDFNIFLSTSDKECSHDKILGELFYPKKNSVGRYVLPINPDNYENDIENLLINLKAPSYVKCILKKLRECVNKEKNGDGLIEHIFSAVRDNDSEYLISIIGKYKLKEFYERKWRNYRFQKVLLPFLLLFLFVFAYRALGFNLHEWLPLLLNP